MERRDAPRLRKSIAVRYKFLSDSVQEKVVDGVHDGRTSNISLGGMMLVGQVPDLDWLKGMLIGRIHIGVNLTLPGHAVPLKGLCAVSWIDSMDATARMTRIGLRFIEMPAEHKHALG
ncbi:MAG: PilZ domain-containing protein, partial [Planctomycetota bacterium]